MSTHDEIGDLSGSQIHYWPGQRTREIVDNFPFGQFRSNFTLDRDVSLLEPEIRAAEIARNVYGQKDAEFSTLAMQLAAVRARTIASLIDPPFSKESPKQIMGFIGQKHFLVQWSQELAWLSFALDFGVTATDLISWGVDKFVVVQLVWWQRDPYETLLNQHIRALRNGWALPALSLAVRDTYENLIRFVDKGDVSQQFLDDHSEELDQVRELLDFFAAEHDELTEDQTRTWARAFEQNIDFIVPDAKGRWGMLPKVSLKNGELRWPTNEIARYFEKTNVSASNLKSLNSDYFVRVKDGMY